MVKAVIDEKATGSSISSVSQTSIPTPCATSTRDEDTFGLECDLDVYNVVATNDFNMGAM